MINLYIDARTNPSVKASQDYMSGKSITQDSRQYSLDKLFMQSIDSQYNKPSQENK